MARIKTERKCQHCDEKGKKSIVLESDDFVVVETGKAKKVNKFYHRDCYIKHLISKGFDELEAINKVDGMSKKYKEEIMNKSRFFEFIYEFYETSSLGSYYFMRVDEVVCGVYKNLKESISYEDLLTMYKKQATFLDKTASQKQRKGEGFKSIDLRAVFDLAIIVSKYDSFKLWKQRQTLLSTQTKKNEENSKIDKEITKATKNTYINNSRVCKNKSKIKKSDEIDIEELF